MPVDVFEKEMDREQREEPEEYSPYSAREACDEESLCLALRARRGASWTGDSTGMSVGGGGLSAAMVVLAGMF